MQRYTLAFVLALASCTVGEVADPQNAGVTTADAGGPAADADPAAPDATPIAALCQEIPPGLPSGNHNAGQPCLLCHDGQTANAPLFSLAGTLYQSAAGTAASPAGTISITDANGTVIELLSARNGNFYTEQAVVFPIVPTATNCGQTNTMPDPVLEPGNCNVAGCHSAGRRIY